MKILVTGAAGFIGAHLSHRLLSDGHEVIGLDNLNDYYDISLKQGRLDHLLQGKLPFHHMDLIDKENLFALCQQHSFDSIVNLAAQPGVRYSLDHPEKYIQSNLLGFSNILEACRYFNIPLVFASSSSVYGSNTSMPFSEADSADHPLSLYGATKKANEVMAHSYAHLFNIPSTGLRFFTVYGPWGRPDMALFKFTRQILSDEPIEIYNHGIMLRDFTYIDDIIAGIVAVINKPATPDPLFNTTDPDPGTSHAPYRLYNIGNNQPVLLNDVIDALELALNKKAIRLHLDMQPGDVTATHADVSRLSHDMHFKPDTPIHIGIQRFVEWYHRYY